MKLRNWLSFLIALMYCQAINGQTTQEEYNFITKGYQFTIEYGLDMKQGYNMKFLKAYHYSTDFRSQISGFFRASGELAGYLVQVTDGSFQKAICIPTENSSDTIWQQYDYLLQTLPLSTQRYYTITISQFLSQKSFASNNESILPDSLNNIVWQDAEEGTGGIIIPKKTNPLLPSNIQGINHHTIRFKPDPPQTAKNIHGQIKLNFCVNKVGEIIDVKVLAAESDIKDKDIINFSLLCTFFKRNSISDKQTTSNEVFFLRKVSY